MRSTLITRGTKYPSTVLLVKMAGQVENVLQRIGLSSIYLNFKNQRIDTIDLCKSLEDKDLCTLGLSTIGDRARFRAEIRNAQAQHCQQAGSTPSSSRDNTADEAVRERSNLFNASRCREPRVSSKKKKGRTWTSSFLCLSDQNQKNIPNSSEKECLFKAGLGLKKITFNSNDTEKEVQEKLLKEFPKLENSGGFELMCCNGTTRTLRILNCKWDVQTLKSVVGPQGRFYVRPLQRSLTVTDVVDDLNTESNIKVSCLTCEGLFAVSEIRQHISCCTEELPDLPALAIVTPAETIHVGEELLRTPDYENDFIENAFVQSLNNFDDLEVPTNHVLGMTELTQLCIDEIRSHNLDNPIDILKVLQAKIVKGRQLDISAEDVQNGTCITGDTNFLSIDRFRLLDTAMEAIETIDDLRLTLEIQFYGEMAEDFGGPRREFFSLILPAIQEKYFDPLKNCLEKDYETVGKIFALSMLQNGKLPRVFNEDMLHSLMNPDTLGPMQFLRRGMNALGLVEIAEAHPALLHLITQENRPPLTLKMLTHLLKPQFSATGSNLRVTESTVYQKFVKYTREVAAGRRNEVTLGKILSFVTGVDEEPPLGFTVPPTLTFIERLSHLPTSNTCINQLTLSIPAELSSLPDDKLLFDLYDYSFSNTYFGLV